MALADQELGDGLGGPGELVDGAEQRAHEEHQEVAGYVGGRGRHKGCLQAVQNGHAETD
ncbi:hypothetical protein SDC9_86732 [bioreactor metagenome]|uniref:Uncharacterized protein n=1 Tax=bioreactor metagenome TaxID=1076179 RepID=A0A644ZR65_9ZZZZ